MNRNISMTTPTNDLVSLLIDDQLFQVSHAFIETLDEIAIMLRLEDRGQALQHALTMAYFLAREGYEKEASTQLLYPNGKIIELKMGNKVERPTFTKVKAAPQFAPLATAPTALEKTVARYKKPIEELKPVK